MVQTTAIVLRDRYEETPIVRELFVSSADLEPSGQNNTLTIRIHRLACPAHDKAMSALLADLTLIPFGYSQGSNKWSIN